MAGNSRCRDGARLCNSDEVLQLTQGVVDHQHSLASVALVLSLPTDPELKNSQLLNPRTLPIPSRFRERSWVNCLLRSTNRPYAWKFCSVDRKVTDQASL